MLDVPGVLELLNRQYWVVQPAQLRAMGVPARSLDRARARGVLVTVLPGVLKVSATDLTFEARAMALQLYCGPASFLSGPTAGHLLGIRGMPISPVHITVRERRHLAAPTWGRIHQTSWMEESFDIVHRPDGLRVAHPLRMLFGIAALMTQHRLERAAEDAWHRGLVRPDDAAEYLQRIRRSGKTGVIRYQTWLEHALARPRASQSGFEVDVVDAVIRAGLPAPERQHPLVLESGETIHLDLAWPDIRLAVEPGHSWWHGGDLAMERDHARDLACEVLGWQIVRFGEAARRDLAALGRQLAAIYEQRARLITAAW